MPELETVPVVPSSHARRLSSAEWLRYFEANRQNLLPIPWPDGAELNTSEREAIAASIAEFQLGESSEGKHLIRFAKEHAERTGDPDYAKAMALFIAEENRHARELGRFMEIEGIPRRDRALADGVFRSLRKLAGLELSVSVLVTAEIIAQVYYRALRRATRSRALRTLCRQILRDEKQHVRFQCERLSILRRGRGRIGRALTEALQRLLMVGAVVVVWHNHRSALRAGGFSLRRFWRTVWLYAGRGFSIAEPTGTEP